MSRAVSRWGWIAPPSASAKTRIVIGVGIGGEVTLEQLRLSVPPQGIYRLGIERDRAPATVGMPAALRCLRNHSGSLHILRHTAATLALTSGVPLHILAARLGDTPQTILATYAHLLPQSDEIAAERVAAALASSS